MQRAVKPYLGEKMAANGEDLASRIADGRLGGGLGPLGARARSFPMACLWARGQSLHANPLGMPSPVRRGVSMSMLATPEGCWVCRPAAGVCWALLSEERKRAGASINGSRRPSPGARMCWVSPGGSLPSSHVVPCPPRQPPPLTACSLALPCLPHPSCHCGSARPSLPQPQPQQCPISVGRQANPSAVLHQSRCPLLAPSLPAAGEFSVKAEENAEVDVDFKEVRWTFSLSRWSALDRISSSPSAGWSSGAAAPAHASPGGAC